MRSLIVLIVIFAFATTSALAQCEGRKDGYYAHDKQCDAYIRCKDGEASEELCEDGLVFNERSNSSKRNCQFPTGVDCSKRPLMQPAQPSGECPHQFAMIGKCQTFVQCIAGQAGEIECPEGLVFNDRTGVCDWPDRVPECKMEEYFGFTCPEATPEQLALFKDHARYPHPNYDDLYFVCVTTNALGERNLSPRVLQCSAGTKFDREQLSCQPFTEQPTTQKY